MQIDNPFHFVAQSLDQRLIGRKHVPSPPILEGVVRFGSKCSRHLVGKVAWIPLSFRQWTVQAPKRGGAQNRRLVCQIFLVKQSLTKTANLQQRLSGKRSLEEWLVGHILGCSAH